MERAIALDGVEERTEVTLRLPATRRVNVRVVEAEDRPVARAIVDTVYEGRRIYARVDANGRAMLEIPEDVKSIRVQPFDYKLYATPNRVEIPDGGDEVVIRLERAVSIRGTIQKPDGSPIPRAMVEGLVNGARKHVAVANANGEFNIKCGDDVVDLIFRGQISGSGMPTYVPYAGELKGVRAGAELALLKTTSLTGEESLTVRVLGPDGPLEGLPVFFQPGLSPTDLKRTDAGGRVRFEKLAPTERIVRVFGKSSDGQLWKEMRIAATPGQGEVTFRLKRPITLRGRVVDAAGEPVKGIMITICAADDEAKILGGGMTPEDGTFSAAVSPGERVRITAVGSVKGKPYGAEREVDDTESGLIELKLVPSSK